MDNLYQFNNQTILTVQYLIFIDNQIPIHRAIGVNFDFNFHFAHWLIKI